MKFKELANYLSLLEKTSSRNEITEILARLFQEVGVDEIQPVVYLVTGRLAPSYKNIVFNIAERMMLEALSEAFGKEKQEVAKLYKEKGDIGDVAAELTSYLDTKLSVREVYLTLIEIAELAGEGSQEQKITHMANLLKRLDSESARFVARIPIGKLRLGFSDKTIIDALSYMERGDKSGKKQLEAAYQVLPDSGLLAQEVKKLGLDKASKSILPQIGIPVQAMLAQRLKSPSEMIKKMGKVAVEPKLDGLRIAIHFRRGKFVKAYTRNLNEVTWMFPELSKLGNHIKGDEVILDTEAMGVNEELKSLANFQTTMTRRRKHNITETQAKIGIKFFVFDILFKDGKGVLALPYPQRRTVLEKTIKTGTLLHLVDYIVTEDPKEIARLNVEYRKQGFEGIMVKRYDSGYVPGRTGWRWVKMKEGEADFGKLSDTVDVIVMGYYAGRGKRAGFGIGGFLAGVRNGDKIVTITKVGTGLSDEQFRELRKRLDKIKVNEKPKEYSVHKNLEPDVWVKPKEVVELAGDDMTVSPNHTAGFAIRFPRLVKFRDDKNPQEATTLKEIKNLFDLQKG